ncbi:MAG: alpha/beta hydrolase fold domain-containing protein [Anaerofustis sp.]
MPSKLAKFVECVFKILHVKNNKFIKRIEKIKLRNMPFRFLFRYHTERIKIRKRSLITLSYRTKSRSDLHIIYLHGGAYTQPAYSAHWRLISEYLSKLKCKVSFVDYPLAPKSTFRDVYHMLEESYQFLTAHYHADRFILMGDSAGGGLALGFLQKLHNEAQPMPFKTVLYSPWLDLSMSNPQIKQIEELDWMLAADQLLVSAAQYADGEDLKQPMLSPIYGDLNRLGDIAVFYGTHEIFVADCRKLRKLAKDADSRFVFFEYPCMQHDFILFPIPEADSAFCDTVAFIDS